MKSQPRTNIWLNILVAAIAYSYGFVKPAEITPPGASSVQPGV